jgi:hypothetical protein
LVGNAWVFCVSVRLSLLPALCTRATAHMHRGTAGLSRAHTQEPVTVPPPQAPPPPPRRRYIYRTYGYTADHATSGNLPPPRTHARTHANCSTEMLINLKSFLAVDSCLHFLPRIKEWAFVSGELHIHNIPYNTSWVRPWNQMPTSIMYSYYTEMSNQN